MTAKDSNRQVSGISEPNLADPDEENVSKHHQLDKQSGRLYGYVKFFNSSKGYGFIIPTGNIGNMGDQKVPTEGNATR